MQKLLLKKILKSLSYLLYAIVIFIIFAYYNFPFDDLKDNITRKLEIATGKKIYAQSLFPVLPIGFGMENIAVKNTVKKSGPNIFSADKIQATINLMSILSLKKNVDFSLNAYGGDISGNIDFNKDKIEINTKFKNISTDKYPLKKLKIMHNPISANLTGSGKIDLKTSGKNISEGVVSINIQGGIVDNFKIYNFKLPPLHYQEISSKFNFKNQKLTINSLKMKGKNAEIMIDGDINLKKRLQTSPIRLNVKFKISPVYLKNAGIPPGIINTRKKDSKGFSSIKLIGTIGRPNVRF